jgi:tRNA pseudouridine55 synthase
MMRDVATDGLVAVDKPAGITSHGVTEHLRRALGTRRIGHAGTLDPFATGLLLLLVGRATRLLPYLDIEPKVYRATVRFGARTSTDDPDGEVVERAAVPTQAAVEAALPALTGQVMQRPPAFSAKSVGGTRAYVAARRGTPLRLEPVNVRVHEWRILGRDGADLDVEVTCSGGTYVRALARDLGEASGSAAHLVALRRLRSGAFTVDSADSMSAAEAGHARVLRMVDLVAHLAEQHIDDADVRRIVHGQPITARVDGETAALRQGDSLVAIACRSADEWRPKVVLRDVV